MVEITAVRILVNISLSSQSPPRELCPPSALLKAGSQEEDARVDMKTKERDHGTSDQVGEIFYQSGGLAVRGCRMRDIYGRK